MPGTKHLLTLFTTPKIIPHYLRVVFPLKRGWGFKGNSEFHRCFWSLCLGPTMVGSPVLLLRKRHDCIYHVDYFPTCGRTCTGVGRCTTASLCFCMHYMELEWNNRSWVIFFAGCISEGIYKQLYIVKGLKSCWTPVRTAK